MRHVILLAALVMAIASSSSTFSAPILKVSGDIRYRSEFGDLAFDTASAISEQELLRTRIGLDVIINPRVRIFAQAQDSRVLGSSDVYTFQTGTTTNSKNLDLHQGYIQVDSFPWKHTGFKVGRFEYVVGDGRILSNYDWDNVGRSFEGSLGWYAKGNTRIELFTFDLSGKVPDYYSSQSIFLTGIHAGFSSLSLDLLALSELYSSQIHSWTIAWSARKTYAAQFQRQIGRYRIRLDAAYQDGDPWGPFAGSGSEKSISAYMTSGELGLDLLNGNASIAGLWDITSGDDNSGDDVLNAYNNLYYDAHAFRGNMGYFAGPLWWFYHGYNDFSGLTDLGLRTTVKPWPMWEGEAALHYFKTAVNYRPIFSGPMTKRLGWELDLSGSTKILEDCRFDAGASFFFPSDAFANTTNSRPGFWLYTGAAVAF